MNEEEKKSIERCKELIKETHSCWIGLSNQEAIKTILNLSENQKAEIKNKDKRISDLEYALIDMVMQFADRPKIKDCHYALSTMGLSALETAFAELDFDDPVPVAEAEKKYKVLVDKYFERKVENEN